VPLATQEDYRLAPTGAAPAEARRLVRESVSVQFPDETVHTAELLVSELVTNAITHGTGPVVVTIEYGSRAVTVTVSDGSSDEPSMQPERLMSLGGRGLRMIETLASAWGVRPRPEGGKDVWFRLT
jgi:anti-sigma regulatory factor (Ser/Thr protein kinase)